MWEIIRRNPQTMIIAVLLHVLIVGLMIVGLDWLKQPTQNIQRVDVVQARLVDAEKLQQRKQEQKQKEVAAAKQEQERLQAEKEKRDAAERKRKQQAEAKKKAEMEKQRQIALKKKKEAEKKKKAEQEKKRKLEQKKKQAEEERKRRLEQEKKAKAEAAKKKKAAEEKKKAEEKRKAEAERKRQADAAKKRAEQQAREAQMAEQMQADLAVGEGLRIAAVIQSKVQSNWTFFPGAVDRGLRCKVKVRVNSNGSVLAVRIVESSGDAAFDRSVETAVYKTDPFPMPESAALRALPKFREHEFYFNPSK